MIKDCSECAVPKPLRNLNSMIGCEVFYGNIVLQGGTLLPPREALKPFSVIGCIVVKKSQVENLDFLRNLQKVEKPDWACKNGE
ncbi:unnamed protein product [Nippostrongylus brasiliensis]|uniref:Recep_L_domain domain-containing protein n=1 Tax=Nippostrongylus brasiliensis TaxID=27835 RepID=A0A0N4XJ93_NIPBR|nr:unnamed protein product [Nippostrongylus brasiliensis]